MEYKHFSHCHTLALHRLQAGQQFHCQGCQLPCQDSTFVCWKCNFFLHEHCGNADRYVKHPSHLSHPLILMPSPTYCSSTFLCNACGAPGTSFTYSCALCEVDLHMQCAYLPFKVSHKAHQHDVYLTFTAPERSNSNSPDYCRICAKELSRSQWSYFCDRPECDFRVHTFCATSEVKPGLYQDDDQGDGIPTTAMPSGHENTGIHHGQGHARTDLTPEEEVALEMSRMQMELQLAQGLAGIIAYFPK